ncbi:S8 family serine peptidase [Candidatus Nitrosotalea bavarica]|uniref:S8 family serine peptidase n=1 Tax=Candidatus Nitrosotalea bavarica TaxID=1903277 RepID=UPI000C70FBDC|nr:S8 family serine peptidase [Candidatus Nitrosotalea bavarica]
MGGVGSATWILFLILVSSIILFGNINSSDESPNRVIPNDPLFDKQWHLNATEDYHISAPEGWAIQNDCSKVVVAVIDTGIDFSHPDLQNNVWTNPVDGSHGFDFPDNTNDPTPNLSNQPTDPDHGTEVAGVIGAEGNNGIGVTGICWHVKLMALKVFPDNYVPNDPNFQNNFEDSVTKALAYVLKEKLAGENIKVVNISLRGLDSVECINGISNLLQQLKDNNVLVVVAAGNDKENFDKMRAYPACYSAQSDNVITVGGTDKSGNLWTRSASGNAVVNIAAPAIDILSTSMSNGFIFTWGDNSQLNNSELLSYLHYLVGTQIIEPVKANITYTSNMQEMDISSTFRPNELFQLKMDANKQGVEGTYLNGANPVRQFHLTVVPSKSNNLNVFDYTWNDVDKGSNSQYGYVYSSGTSLASPMVSGTAALVAAHHPDWNYAQIKNAILSGADIEEGLKGSIEGGRILDVFGALEKGSISGSIFIDNNKDGRFDSGDTPIKDSPVSILAVGDLTHFTNYSDAIWGKDYGTFHNKTRSNENFTFDNIMPGYVSVSIPTITGLQLIPPGTNSSNPGSAYPGHSINIDWFLEPGQNITGLNYVYQAIPNNVINGRLFLDTNGNGVFQNDKPGIARASIYATICEQSISSTSTPLCIADSGNQISVLAEMEYLNSWTTEDGVFTLWSQDNITRIMHYAYGSNPIPALKIGILIDTNGTQTGDWHAHVLGYTPTTTNPNCKIGPVFSPFIPGRVIGDTYCEYPLSPTNLVGLTDLQFPYQTNFHMKVTGHVFVDDKNTTQYDPSDQQISNVKVSLKTFENIDNDSDTKTINATTLPDGSYSIDNAPVGIGILSAETPDGQKLIKPEKSSDLFELLPLWELWGTFSPSSSATNGAEEYGNEINSTCNEDANGDCAFGNVSDQNFVLAGPKDHLPIILIPGIAGTELRINDHQAWPIPNPLYTSINDLKLNPDGSSINNVDLGGILDGKLRTGGPLTNVYGPMIKYLVKDQGYVLDKDLFVFPYDWRLDNAQHFGDLDNKISEAMQKSGKNAVIILAHSMGGILAKGYIMSGSSHVSNIDSLITMGTPYWGAPKAFYALVNGYQFGNPLVSVSKMKTLAQNAAAAYQLLPRVPFVQFYNGSANVTLNRDVTYNTIRYSGATPCSPTIPCPQSLNQYLLQNANNYYSKFGNFYNPAVLPFGIKNFVIVGTGVETLHHYYLRPYNVTIDKSSIQFALPNGKVFNGVMKPSFGDGDGTVPAWSAYTRNATKVWYVPDTVEYSAAHVDLLKNKAVQDIVGLVINAESKGFTPSGNPDWSSDNYYQPPLRHIKEGIIFDTDFTLHSDAHMTIISNNDGGKLGYDGNDTIDENIPTGTFLSIDGVEYASIKDMPESYRVLVNGTNTGEFTLTISVSDGNETQLFSYPSVHVDKGTVAELNFNPIDITPTTLPNLSVNSSGAITSVLATNGSIFNDTLALSPTILPSSYASNSTMSNLSVISEFPFAIPVMLIGIVSVIASSRMKFKK